MNEQSRTAQLKQAIQDFESKADMPVAIQDPDRRDQWELELNQSFDRMRELVERQRKEVHSKVFAEISKQDPSERDEITQMRHSDERIAELMDVMKAHIASFALGATDDGRGPDIEKQVLDLRNVSHDLAACVLAQEESVAGWFAETFEADA
jgi:hypothetical protein